MSLESGAATDDVVLTTYGSTSFVTHTAHFLDRELRNRMGTLRIRPPASIRPP